MTNKTINTVLIFYADLNFTNVLDIFNAWVPYKNMDKFVCNRYEYLHHKFEQFCWYHFSTFLYKGSSKT